MVDTADLKSADRKVMGVRLSPEALDNFNHFGISAKHMIKTVSSQLKEVLKSED